MSYNSATLIGRVGKDPEIKKFENGGQVAQFTLATTAKWKTKTGEQKERTEWHNIIITSKLTEVVERFVKKGDLLFITGEIRYREYQKGEEKRYITEIFCDVMQMLGSKDNKPTGQPSDRTAQIFPDKKEDVDDLPFD